VTITFGDDSFDTERELMRALETYVLLFTFTDGREEDVVFLTYDHENEGYAYRLWSDEAHQGVGDVMIADPDELASVHIY
jgi:hypothetical protein